MKNEHNKILSTSGFSLESVELETETFHLEARNATADPLTPANYFVIIIKIC